MSQIDSTAVNRRISPRRAPKGRVRVACRQGGLALGPNVALSVLDLSETGARLVVRQPLEPGQEVAVGLEGETNARPVVCVGTVAWCVPSADASYCVGVRFQRRLPYRDFVQLTREAAAPGVETPPSVPDPSPAPPAPEAPAAASEAEHRRRAERHSSQRLLLCRLSPAGGADLDATLLDLSETGAGLMASGPLKTGDDVVLHLPAAGVRRPPFELAARVVYAVELNLGWFLLGMEFPRPLGDDDMRAVLARMGHAAVAVR